MSMQILARYIREAQAEYLYATDNSYFLIFRSLSSRFYEHTNSVIQYT